MNNTDLILPIIFYGILWGAYYFWGYNKLIQKVTTNPENHSKFTVMLCQRLTLFPKTVVSVITALLVPLLVIGLISLLLVLRELIN